TSPSLARGSATTKTGRPEAIADARPDGSVSTTTAPAAAAAAQNLAPCTVLPGSAAYRSPGRTALESWVTPVSTGAAPEASGSGSAGRKPSNAASPASRSAGT